MNKSTIQRFAIQTRKSLIDGVSQRAFQYGITAEGYGEENAMTVGEIVLSSDEQRQRRELVEQIRSKGYTQVMEEVAYTWFNRIIALRFMEVNNYLPSHIRVFSDSTGKFNPEILNDALYLDLPGLNKEKVAGFIEKNQTEDLYRYLLLTQCNALNEALPRMFERMGGFTELLLPNNILKQANSVLGQMVNDIPEEDWKDQVQIIGWLYQYYNSELKDDTFALLKKNVKITKERIPSATQLFTPDWIVRYMVENSLGRIFIVDSGKWLVDSMSEAERIAKEKETADKLGWKYYLPEAEQTPEVRQQLNAIHSSRTTDFNVKDIKIIDPCMGSGHILVYAFDVLVQIYKTYGINERDAAQSILKNNLYGLDIDERAAQLAYFAVMMKARQYDRRIFSRGIQPHIYAIVESNRLDRSTIEYFTNNDPKLEKDFGTLVEELRDAKEYGSILNISPVDFAALYARVDQVREDKSIFREIVLNSILPLIQVAEVMAQKYDVVVTNPPYMGSSGMSAKLSDYVKTNYPDSKSDLFAVFIEKCSTMLKKYRYQAMITQHAWMFLSSFEKLRSKILLSDTVNMAHLGARAFEEIGGEVVQTTSFVFRNSHIKNSKGVYCRLVEPTTQKSKEDMFLAGENRFESAQDNFSKIPGSPIAYWASRNIFRMFDRSSRMSELAEAKKGLVTGNDDVYLKLWHEIDISEFSIYSGFSGTKWKPCNKGGSFRKWYGNNEYVVNWGDDGSELANHRWPDGRQRSSLRNSSFFFREALTWTYITSANSCFRYYPNGYAFAGVGPGLFLKDTTLMYYVLGYVNSIVFCEIMKMIGSSTISLESGEVEKAPVIIREKNIPIVNKAVVSCISIGKTDWDSFETSWGFQRHPLVVGSGQWVVDSEKTNHSSLITNHYKAWETECNERFRALKANEEELNRIFIDIYGLQDELTPEVEDKDVTVRRADLGRDIRSLISYAVGCMFGRYSLDVDGLAYAGGEWEASKYRTFPADKDNIIPICDDEYFEDDITGLFVQFVETLYGKETLEENLKFIADALGGKGTSREVIRNYFLNDFYADHLKIYQKRPIYWLFDSGKKNGFKALIYMHRYQSDLLARIRTDYVHEQQERYRTQLTHLADAIAHASTSERVMLTRKQKKIQEQALEIQKYEEKVHHLADQNISIDLDDGVKHNYALFADVLAKIK